MPEKFIYRERVLVRMGLNSIKQAHKKTVTTSKTMIVRTKGRLNWLLKNSPFSLWEKVRIVYKPVTSFTY